MASSWLTNVLYEQPVRPTASAASSAATPALRISVMANSYRHSYSDPCNTIPSTINLPGPPAPPPPLRPPPNPPKPPPPPPPNPPNPPPNPPPAESTKSAAERPHAAVPAAPDPPPQCRRPRLRKATGDRIDQDEDDDDDTDEVST